jgi:hypothetical protein
MRAQIVLLCLSMLAAAGAQAADLPGGARGGGEGAQAGGRLRAAAETCPLWQPPYGIRIVPTNDWCDPTYVGSSMGLSRPSYYGTRPGPGFDAP